MQESLTDTNKAFILKIRMCAPRSHDAKRSEVCVAFATTERPFYALLKVMEMNKKSSLRKINAFVRIILFKTTICSTL